MKTINTVFLAAASLMLGTAAAAQAAQGPSASQETRAPSWPNAARNAHPLFTIGHLEVHVWAPVEPHYDANMNRTIAGDPPWDGE
jgi:ABC-type glycerol-3-phosphate transport system substrate-binding protein